MNRRAVASLLDSVVSAGCLEVLQSSAETNEKVVGLRINNLFDGSRTVDIETSPLQETTTDERSFANSFDIEADSDVRKERPACRRLQRHCSNHEWRDETEEWHMGGSKTNEIIVDIGEGGITVQAARHE